MRFQIPASTQARALPTRIVHGHGKRNWKFQIFDPVTVFFSRQQADLLQLDAIGNPLRGFKITGPMTAPQDFLAFTGEMFVSCNQNTEIEVDEWSI